MKLREMDERTTYLEQLQEDEGQVVLINQFEVPPEEARAFARERALKYLSRE